MIDYLKFLLAVSIGKSVICFSRIFNFGNGSTWPGHLALKLYPDVLVRYLQKINKKIIIIAGTNGKTTTAKMIRTALESQKATVVHNESGANLLNGIVSSLIQKTDSFGNFNSDFAIFEVDEATLPLLLKFIEKNNGLHKKIMLVLLNLFRDQLDRYGEVDTIARKWSSAVQKIPGGMELILNADDPQIAEIGLNQNKNNIVYFGLSDQNLYLKNKQHATDSTYCLSCGSLLSYQGVYYSHLGDWYCTNCPRKKPDVLDINAPFVLDGVYNKYNTLAAFALCRSLGITDKIITESLKDFQPAFGRQENLKYQKFDIKILLSKNPVGFNVSIESVLNNANSKATIILALNDHIPDGRDVSWIWDTDLELLLNRASTIICTGDRALDMALRVKYALSSDINTAANFMESKVLVEKNMKSALNMAVKTVGKGETIYLLPTYSAMLAMRKLITGREIL